MESNEKLFSLSVLVGLLMLLLLSPQAQAQNPPDDFLYQIQEGQVTITDYHGSSSQVTVPSTIEDCPVVALGSWVFTRQNFLLSVELPETLTTIGTEAFSYCRNLQKVTLGSQLVSIGNYAFYACASLCEISLPPNLSYLGANAFDSCASLTEITIPSGITQLNDWTFFGCTRLENVTFSLTNSLTSIGKEAFCRSGLLRIELPSQLTELDPTAFSYCTRLTQIEANSTSTFKTVEGCLYNLDLSSLLVCPGGKSGTFTLPETVTEIATFAFSGCSHLENIEVAPDNPFYTSQEGVLYSIDKTTLIAFPGGRLGQYEIPEGTLTLGDHSFNSANQLLSLIAPSGLTHIGDNAFWYCSKLKGIGFEGNAPTVGERVFYDVPTFLYLYYRAGATGWEDTLADYPALGDSVDQTITFTPFPEEITYGAEDFQLWANSNAGVGVSIVSENEDVATVDDYKILHPTGVGTAILTAIQPGGTRRRVNYFPAPTVSLTLKVNPKEASVTPAPVSACSNHPLPSFTSTAQGLINEDTLGGTPVYFINGTPADEVMLPLAEGTYELTVSGWEHKNYLLTFLPSTLTILPPDPFEYSFTKDGILYLTKYTGNEAEVTIPDVALSSDSPVQGVLDTAFLGCTNLTQLTLGRNVKDFNLSNFLNIRDTQALQSILVPQENESYSSLDGVLFDKTQTVLIAYPTGRAGSYNVPSQVQTIGASAFQDCLKLTEVIIPEGVSSIETLAFCRCSALTSICIPSSVKELQSATFRECSSLTQIEVSPDNHDYSSLEGVLFDKAQTTLITCPAGKTGAYTVPENVTTLGNSAFAFAAKLTTITLPASVTLLGANAFSSCTGLEAIYFWGNSPEIEEDHYLFYNCTCTLYYKEGTSGWTDPWHNLHTALWETTPKLSVSEVEKDEAGKVIAFTLVTTGTLQSSSDLKVWSDVTPTPTVNTYRIVVEPGQNLYFRASSL